MPLSLPSGITMRYAFLLMVVLLATLLVALTVRSGYHRDLHIAFRRLVIGSGDRDVTDAPTKPPPMPNMFRFPNGRISYTSSRYGVISDLLDAYSPAELENQYENAVLEITADCTTSRRLGRREDGGWDMCLVGPFVPQEPCFSFSYGINNIWEFDDEVASVFKCQVLTFDPSMTQASHMRNEKVAFHKEGLYGAKSMLNGWRVDSYLGFLTRFGAQNFVIDILKMDVEGSEWLALETAVRDGSLKNVKQLMLEFHIQLNSVPKHFPIFKALHELGFRQWHHNWNIYGSYQSQLNKDTRSCCHEIYYININFLASGRSARNPPGTRIAAPLTGGARRRR